MFHNGALYNVSGIAFHLLTVNIDGWQIKWMCFRTLHTALLKECWKSVRFSLVFWTLIGANYSLLCTSDVPLNADTGKIILKWTTSLDTSPSRFICVCVYLSEVMTPHCLAHERTADRETQSGLICICRDDEAIHYKLYLLKLTMAVDNIVFRIIKGAF